LSSSVKKKGKEGLKVYHVMKKNFFVHKKKKGERKPLQGSGKGDCLC